MDIRPEIRQYVIENFLSGEQELDDSMPLVTGGLIDSVGMIGLVQFIEKRFQIEFQPRGLGCACRFEAFGRTDVCLARVGARPVVEGAEQPVHLQVRQRELVPQSA